MDEDSVENDGAKRVHARVSEIGTNCVTAVTVDDTLNSFSDDRKRVVPRNLFPGCGFWVIAPSDYRHAQAIGISVQLVQHRSLWADKTFGERVIAIATNTNDGAFAHG